MQSNDTSKPLHQSIDTIVWAGDYPAAQQLAGRKITFDRASGMLWGAK